MRPLSTPDCFYAAAVCVLGVVLRLVIWNANGPPTAIEFHQPATSARQLLEAAFLQAHGISPYASHTFAQPPLLLALFMPPLALNSGPYPELLMTVWSRALFLVADLATTFGLIKLVRHCDALPATRFPATAAAVLYLLNPINVLSCCALSLGALLRPVLLFALTSALQGHVIATAVLLSVAIYIDLHLNFTLVLPAALLLSQSRRGTSVVSTSIRLVLRIVAILAQLWYMSCVMLGCDVIELLRLYKARNSYTDLTPNWGVYWYLFQEMFDDFRSFWVWALNLHARSYALPLFIRLHPLKDSGVFLYLYYLAIGCFLSPTPTLADIAFYVTLFFVVYPRFLTQMKHGFTFLSAFLITLFLGPVFYHSWTVSGTGNANFFYFVTLAFNVCHVLFIVQLGTQAMCELKEQRKRETELTATETEKKEQ